MNTKPNFPRVRLPHCVIVRAPGLLPMRYRASELAQALGIKEWRVRDWMRRGAPFEHDGVHDWLVGTRIAEWVERVRSARRETRRLEDHEAWCLRCRAPVQMERVSLRKRGAFWTIAGTCPTCGGKVRKQTKG